MANDDKPPSYEDLYNPNLLTAPMPSLLRDLMKNNFDCVYQPPYHLKPQAKKSTDEGTTMKIEKRCPVDGFYVYSSCGSGDESAIRLCHIECNQPSFEVAISPEEAIQLANLIIEVATEYQNGIETGLD